ncbi:excalibur calcium-binding domain-containing protein [Nocardia nova]|uniref:excalibur calcium-binding domain-containing protein n=1 Tax=Nocardia nova TaxID=37330 RepID=UPI00372116BF
MSFLHGFGWYICRSRSGKKETYMQAIVSILTIIWIAMVVIAGIGLIRGHLDWARLHSRKAAGGLLAASLPVFVLIGLLAPKDSGTTRTPAIPHIPVTTVPAAATPVSSTPTAPSATTAVTTTADIPFQSPASPPPPSTVPAPVPAPAFVPAPAAAEPPAAPPSEAYYPNCAAARAAGAAPILRGQPGYRPGLDRDNDGIACE